MEWDEDMTAVCLTGAFAEHCLEQNVTAVVMKGQEPLTIDVEKCQKMAGLRSDLLSAFSANDERAVKRAIKAHKASH